MTTEHKAVVTAVTRRYVELYCDSSGHAQGRLATKALHVCVGDSVRYTSERETILIDAVEERQNCLVRCYNKKTKQLGANLDHLFVVAAPNPLFNTVVIDRLLASAAAEGIETTLVINKIDLANELERTEEAIAVYERLPINVIRLSAKTGDRLDDFEARLCSADYNIVALAGISGVGKSTILNHVVPDAEAHTAAVSEQTGQGRQTTAQSIAHLKQREVGDPMFIVDLPGIQSYGVQHLSIDMLKHAFVEFEPHLEVCQFANCNHINEPVCGVREALQVGEIAQTRYDSYREMYEEIDSFREYE